MYIYIYIYVRFCVCVCVCVWVENLSFSAGPYIEKLIFENKSVPKEIYIFLIIYFALTYISSFLLSTESHY